MLSKICACVSTLLLAAFLTGCASTYQNLGYLCPSPKNVKPASGDAGAWSN